MAEEGVKIEANETLRDTEGSLVNRGLDDVSKNLDVLESENLLDRKIRTEIERKANEDLVRSRTILENIQQSGEAIGMAGGPTITYTHPELDEAMITRERSDLRAFSDPERATILSIIQNATGATFAQKKDLTDLFNNRFDLQAGVASWTTAFYDYDNNHDKRKKEYVESMQLYELMSDPEGFFHPAKRQPKLDAAGNPILDVNGKPIYHPRSPLSLDAAGNPVDSGGGMGNMLELYPGVPEALEYIQTFGTASNPSGPQVIEVELWKGKVDPLKIKIPWRKAKYFNKGPYTNNIRRVVRAAILPGIPSALEAMGVSPMLDPAGNPMLDAAGNPVYDPDDINAQAALRTEVAVKTAEKLMIMRRQNRKYGAKNLPFVPSYKEQARVEAVQGIGQEGIKILQQLLKV